MSPSSIDQQWMDRLVDGELNESERLELLSRLDLEPGAWKRCAVTFLEAQMWHSSFRSGVANQALVPSRPAARRKFVPPVLYAAMAASVLTAFTLGWSLGDRQSSAGFSMEMARTALGGSERVGSHGEPPSQGALNLPHELEGASQSGELANGKESTAVKGASSTDRPLLNLAAAGVGSEAKGRNEATKSGLALPVVREWQRRGYQIEKEPQFVSMTTKDGRKVAVPVDAVRLRFIGDRIY